MGRNITLPPDVRGTVYFVDEAGSKGSLGTHFVTAAVKTDRPDQLSRKILEVLDRHHRNNLKEIKFAGATKNNVVVFRDVMTAAVDIGCEFGVFVLDKSHFDPWEGSETWRGHLFAADRLLRGMVTRRELATVLTDGISVPAGVDYGGTLINQLNGRFGNKRFLTGVSLDSQTCPPLQVADLLASAVFFYRKTVADGSLAAFNAKQNPKGQLAKHVAAAFGLATLDDVRQPNLSIQTSHEVSLRELRGAVVPQGRGPLSPPAAPA